MTECLFRPDDKLDENVRIEGLVHAFSLHRGRLEAKRKTIEELLRELPEEFRVGSGSGGASFLAACNDRHGHQWGEHFDMEMLFVLGMGIDKAILVASREHWHLLPSGMPWFRLVNM